MLGYQYKIYCPKHQHLSAKITHVCASPDCESRLICQMCTEHHAHKVVIYSESIPIGNFENALSGKSILEQQQQEGGWPVGNQDIIKFLQEADLKESSKAKQKVEIRTTIEKLFKEFLGEIRAKLEDIQNNLVEEMECFFRDAQCKLEYLKIKFVECFDLGPLALSLKQYKQGQITLSAMNGLFRSFFSKDASEVKNIYKHLSQEGRNHNYLDIFQIDLKGFHRVKNKILSNLAQFESFKELVPEHHQSFLLPTSQKPRFSWSLVPKQPGSSLTQVKKTQKVNKLHVAYSEPNKELIQSGENPEERDSELLGTSVVKTIIAVVDQKSVAKYNEKGDLVQCLYECRQNEQLRCVEFRDDFAAFNLHHAPHLIHLLYLRSGKVVRRCDSQLGSVVQICFINKYCLYAPQRLSVVCLNQQGMLKVVGLFDKHHVDYQPYGSGVKEIHVLPDIKTEDALYDLLLCSYSKSSIRMAVRSLFRPVPLSNIVEEESVESQLGLVENEKLLVTTFKMTSYEKKVLSQKIDLANIDYLVVTQLGETMTLWNWKTATFIKRFEVPEGIGLRVYPTIQAFQINNLLIVGADARLYNVHWLNQHIEANKFNLKHISSIHQVSHYFVHFNQGSLCIGYLLALKDKILPQQVFSIVNYQ